MVDFNEVAALTGSDGSGSLLFGFMVIAGIVGFFLMLASLFADIEALTLPAVFLCLLGLFGFFFEASHLTDEANEAGKTATEEALGVEIVNSGSRSGWSKLSSDSEDVINFGDTIIREDEDGDLSEVHLVAVRDGNNWFFYEKDKTGELVLFESE